MANPSPGMGSSLADAMRAHWTRGHGLGNDYLVIEPAALPPGVGLNPATARLICNQHRGVGGDGILELLAARPEPDYFAVRIWNPDGSVAEKSGNGLRIFAKYLAEHGHARGERFTIVTPGGAAAVAVARDAATGLVGEVTVDMGVPRFDPRTTLVVGGHEYAVTILVVGNPHCVVLVPDVAAVPLDVLGPAIERHPAFPGRTNVQFATPLDRERVRAVVWERGAGATLASGSSACAVAAACQRLGHADADVLVAMPGGELRVRRDEHAHLWLTGAVEEICRGTFSADLLAHLRRLSALTTPLGLDDASRPR
jgi:diaminopimelate epimerase